MLFLLYCFTLDWVRKICSVWVVAKVRKLLHLPNFANKKNSTVMVIFRPFAHESFRFAQNLTSNHFWLLVDRSTYIPTYLLTYYLPMYFLTYKPTTYLRTFLPINLLPTYLLIYKPTTYLPSYLPTYYLPTYQPANLLVTYLRDVS